MTGFSENATSSFTGLQLNHIRVLCGLVASQELREKDYVKRRYLEQASDFDATLAFLVNVSFIHDDGSELSLTPVSRRIELHGQEFSKALLSQLARAHGQWRTELNKYLLNYRVCDDKVVHRPTPEQRSSESPIRNFLMELAAVSHDSTQDQYVLKADSHSLLTQACSATSVAPSRVRDNQEAKNEIGLAAERVIVEFEQRRLGREFAHHVDHVALRNAAAGFDVQSVTLRSNYEVLPRFIEVKAVSPTDLCFYWTENEVTVARTFGTWYYLYLLPVGSDGRPRTDLLQMVCDPHKAVLGDPDLWSVESNVLCCRFMAYTRS